MASTKGLPTDEAYHHFVVIFGVLILSFLVSRWLYQQAFGTDVAKIWGIPEPAGAVPVYGHLKALGSDHASKLQQWSRENNWPVFQARLGNRRIIVLNTFEAAQDFIVKNASATIDRPLFYTFHSILSKTQGGTIGTSPWDESCKRRRTVVGSIMTRPAILKSASMLDLEITALIKDLVSNGFGTVPETGERRSMEVNPRLHFQRMALNRTLMMCFATRFERLEDPMLHELLDIALSVSTFRSTNNNLQDYVPFYRYLPQNDRTKLAIANRVKRDEIFKQLLDKVAKALEEGKPVDCISSGLLNEKGRLTDAEIRSVNVSLVSGGFETLSTTGLAGLGYLSSPQGQHIQANAFKAIMEVYSSPEEAWSDCLQEERVPYIVALVREMLRYYAAIQLLPPRQTCKEFEWNGVRIPTKVAVYQNAQAINHDETAYGPDAEEFRPERWLEENSEFKVGAPYHYSFGAGSRMCTAVALSNRILYALFLRLILHFEFTASPTSPPVTHYVDLNEDTTGQTVTVKPYSITMKERFPHESILSNFQTSDQMSKTVHLV
ncbi:Phenylacetate 2-hydroxylase [Exophiala dermatitidis]